MHLRLPDVPDPIPVESLRPDGEGEAIDIRLPQNEPRWPGLTPGAAAMLVRDDGRTRAIVLGQRWTAQQGGAVLRIAIRPRTAAASAPAAPADPADR